jgi:aryl-alcohol dehydrogenase-like predicted oxidoreductase
MLVFGTARLHHLLTRKAQLEVLETAYNVGFRSFDLSPLYGNGLSLHTFGKFVNALGAESSQLSIILKVGLSWPSNSISNYFVRALGRRILGAQHKPIYLQSERHLRDQLYTSLDILKIANLSALLLHEVTDQHSRTEHFLQLCNELDFPVDRIGVSGVSVFEYPEVLACCAVVQTDLNGLKHHLGELAGKDIGVYGLRNHFYDQSLDKLVGLVKQMPETTIYPLSFSSRKERIGANFDYLHRTFS